jgi:hypothetical protein
MRVRAQDLSFKDFCRDACFSVDTADAACPRRSSYLPFILSSTRASPNCSIAFPSLLGDALIANFHALPANLLVRKASSHDST